MGPWASSANMQQVIQDVSLTTGGSPPAGGAGSNTIHHTEYKKKLHHHAWQVAVSYFLTGEMPHLEVSNQNRTLILEQVGAPGRWLHGIAKSISMKIRSRTLQARHLPVVMQTFGKRETRPLLDRRCELVPESKYKSGSQLFGYEIQRWCRCRYSSDQCSRNQCARSSGRTRVAYSFTARILMSQLFTDSHMKEWLMNIKTLWKTLITLSVVLALCVTRLPFMPKISRF